MSPFAPLCPLEVLYLVLSVVSVVTFTLAPPRAVEMVPARAVSMVILTGSISHSPVSTCKEASLTNSFPEVSMNPSPFPVLKLPPNSPVPPCAKSSILPVMSSSELA